MGGKYDLRGPIGDANEALLDFVLDTLRLGGYEPREVRREADWRGVACARASFRLSRVWPGWIFGVWAHGRALLDDSDGEEVVLELFAQHDTAIDKFRPSRSCVTAEVRRRDVLPEIVPWAPTAAEEVLALADTVRRHPFACYQGMTSGGLFPGRAVPTAVREIAHDRLAGLARRAVAPLVAAHAARAMYRLAEMRCVWGCRLDDGGPGSHPRLVMSVRVENDPSDDDLRAVADALPGEVPAWARAVAPTLDVLVSFSANGREMELC